MANTVTVKVLESGQRNALIHVYLKSDGATGELVNQVLLDPIADLGMAAKSRFRLGRIEYNYAGFDAVLGFGSGTVPQENFKWVLTEGTNYGVDFKYWTFIMDNSGVDGNGKLLLSTSRFTNSACQGSMLIQVIK
tara:strand:- start:171 stop:575 length:405 start_codon:yes stop_codon:yes gene_type:complete